MEPDDKWNTENYIQKRCGRLYGRGEKLEESDALWRTSADLGPAFLVGSLRRVEKHPDPVSGARIGFAKACRFPHGRV